jgi:hypothetical protein
MTQQQHIIAHSPASTDLMIIAKPALHEIALNSLLIESLNKGNNNAQQGEHTYTIIPYWPWCYKVTTSSWNTESCLGLQTYIAI